MVLGNDIPQMALDAITSALKDTSTIKWQFNTSIPYISAQAIGISSGSGGGDVFGPGASTDNAVVRWDGAGGTSIKNSGVNTELVGATANFTDFPLAKMVISRLDSTITNANDIGLVVEDTNYAGILSIGKNFGTLSYAYGTGGMDAYGIYGLSLGVNGPGGTNIGGVFTAANASANYAIMSVGDLYFYGINTTRSIWFDDGIAGTGTLAIRAKGGFANWFMTFASDGTSQGLITFYQPVQSINFKQYLALEDPGVGSFTVQIQAPTLAGNYTLTLPVDDGAASQVLTTDGSGILSWTDHGAGVVNYWARVGINLSPTTAGDTVSTSVTGNAFTGTGYTTGATAGMGIHGIGQVTAIGDTGISYGGYFEASTSHNGNDNVAVFAQAVNAAGGHENYSWYSPHGKFYNADDMDIAGKLTVDHIGEHTGSHNIVFDNNALMSLTGNLYFRDTDISISSVNDGDLDLTANANIDLSAPWVNLYPTTGTDVALHTFAFASANTFIFSRAGGTMGSPSSIANGNILGSVHFQGYHSATPAYYSGAIIRATVDAAIGAGAEMPTRLMFYTCPDGSTTAAERLRINNAGNIWLMSDQPICDSIGNEQIKFVSTASAVNEITITNAATTVAPTIAASGETNVNLNLSGKGAGYIILTSSKSTTGNPTAVEGMIYINTFDNKIQMYADSAWRTLVSW